MSYNPSAPQSFNQTNTLMNDVTVSVNSNLITFLNNTYTLPRSILYLMAEQPNPSALTYVTNQFNGMITESVTVSASINSLDTLMPSVMYNYYYMIPNGQTFNCQSVTLQNNRIIATLDPVSMQTYGMYNGQYFTLSGNILTGQTMINSNAAATTTIPTAS